MGRIESITLDDVERYKEIFEKAEILGMTVEEASKIVDDGDEKILFVCGPIWMIFGYNNSVLEYKSFVVNDDKVVSFTNNDYQVNVGNNIVYLIYEDGHHEALQLLKNNDDIDFEVSSNGIVMYMQYDQKKDVRCVSKYEHSVYGSSRIFDMRLASPFEVSIESNASKRDKGFKFLGSRNSYYRLDFDTRNNKWQYDLATVQEYGIGAVVANGSAALHGGERSFSRYYKVLLNFGSYVTLTGFPFLQQYTQEDIEEYVESYGFNSEVPSRVLQIYNNVDKYLEYFQDIVLLYNSRTLCSTK